MRVLRSIFLTSNLSKNSTKFKLPVRTMATEENDVLFENVGDKGIIILNRPKALNALNLAMVRKIYPKLKEWESEKSLVIIKGTGGKAFCSGGDIKAVVQAGLRGEKLGHDFFREEYILNGLIGTYQKPYVAIIDGITMGGGVGLSVHGHYRIATEKTLFAMPEMAIGLFPDVGGSYFLPRLGGRLGYFLALTGFRLKGADVVKAGIGTHYVTSDKLNELEQALLKCGNEQGITATLKEFHVKDNSEFSLAPHLKQIDKCFAPSSVEGILQELLKDGSKWALSVHDNLLKMSPTSLKVALRELELGCKLSLQECLKMEYRIAVSCLSNKDFYEGVRAMLIDKDQKPAWSPKKLEDISEDIVKSYFNKLPNSQELQHKL